MSLNRIGSFNVFIPHGRLPWSTLENDLEKRGIGLINWPTDVPRKRGNKGINDLNAAHVDTLYRAIMHPDRENRLGLRYLLPFAGMSYLHCRCHLNDICTVTRATDARHDVVASSSKRPPEGKQESKPPKQARNAFKITTPNDFSGT